MRRCLVLLAVPLALVGCATKNTSTHWTCVAEGDHCTSIAETDARKEARPRNTDDVVIFDSKPARWWQPNPPGTVTREIDPRRDGDQVMRVVIAPFVDAQGDYHARSEIFAVVRRAQWWLTPPLPITAAPEEGTKLNTEKAPPFAEGASQ